MKKVCWIVVAIVIGICLSLIFVKVRDHYISSHFFRTTAEVVDVETKYIGETQSYRFKSTPIYSSRVVLRYSAKDRVYTSEVKMNSKPRFYRGEKVLIWYNRKDPNHIELE